MTDASGVDKAFMLSIADQANNIGAKQSEMMVSVQVVAFQDGPGCSLCKFAGLV